MIFDLAECEEVIGYSFRNKQLLRTAFTHVSYANEHNAVSYERMEYLGDALLGMIVGEYLYHKYPTAGEGELTTRRAKLVSQAPLRGIAQELGLGAFVLLGEGGEKSGERENDKILSSLIESALAAVYLDGGMEPARRFVENCVLQHAEKILRSTSDYKTELQEFVQKTHAGSISYKDTGRSGPDNRPVFECAVLLSGTELARGSGEKKQKAEQDAARQALEILKGESQKAHGEEKKPVRRAKKEIPPKRSRVLSLVDDYGAPENGQEKKSGRQDGKRQKSGRGQKPENRQKNAKDKNRKGEDSAKTGRGNKQDRQNGRKPSAGPRGGGKPAQKEQKDQKKRAFFGFVGNRNHTGDGTPL